VKLRWYGDQRRCVTTRLATFDFVRQPAAWGRALKSAIETGGPAYPRQRGCSAPSISCNSTATEQTEIFVSRCWRVPLERSDTEEQVLRWWHLDRRGTQLRWAFVRLLPRASLPLTLAIAVCLGVAAVAPVFLMLSVGWAISDIGTALGHGPASPGAESLTLDLVRVGGLFTLLRVVVSLTTPIGDQLALRVRAGVFQRILEAHLAPVGVAHLEDPALRDLVERAQDPGAIGPRMAVVGLINRWMLRLGGVGGIVLVALFQWWAGLILLLVLIYGVRRMRIAQVDIARTQFQQTRILRRSDYLRDLLLVPGAEKEVRVFGLARWLRDRFQAEWEEAMARVWRRRRSSVRDAVLAIVPVLLAASGILALAVIDALSGSITAGELVVVLQATLAALACTTIQVSDSLVALGVATLEATMALEDALAGRPEPLGLLLATGLPEREVRFDNVRYSYPGQPRDILKAVNLVIPAGKSLAIVGENGAGKTTLIKLLARLAEPTGGAVYVDGVALRDIDPWSWQKRCVAVFQEFIRYPWSAAENIALREDADPGRLESAARQAGALELVEALPEGWDTRLSRQLGGVDLSGGEWQRIALARALYAAGSGPTILTLDEPTAHLDARQEADFYNHFLDMTAGHTTVIVSHRFASVRRADRIVVLENGHITEEGTHDELVALGRKYAQLFAKQAERFADSRAFGA
jgi:ATP-binding cassette, subfamily B, bacterial